ncbi:RNA-binding protein [Desulfolucanica intricata]|uniref:YlmH family RNA-binding protein n=1 Tax=Desulfolucanica intricata TaxID=1285191 RepID=UPI0008331BAD|nr:YlmH/Sll1252 family protein [Desulfolucanica intricata]
MIDREKIFAYLRNVEEKVIIARVLDQCEIVLRKHQIQVTDFFDPFRTGQIFSIVQSIGSINAKADGGYPSAERKRTVIFPDFRSEDNISSELSYLFIEGNFKMVQVTHGDYLGAILGLGIKRDKIGDIIVLENGAQVIVASEISNYIKSHLVKVGKVKVSITDISRGDITPPEQKFKEIRTTVPSLRMDVIAGAGFGTSRAKIAREIAAERFSLNWHTCSNLSQSVKEKDIISARGRGRVELFEVGGQTKKGRIVVTLRKYL